jgi:hypothetical protein
MSPKSINQLINQTIETYKIKPINIVADFNREVDIKNDYQGRQIFELMQNADDQFINENECNVKVKIEIVENKFIIQNSGEPFDIDGIESLMNPNASPKKLRSNTIGHKGLGFRSVLNWTNSLRIITDNFAVEFNKEYANCKVKELLKDKNILSQIEDRMDKDIIPAAILSFPKEIKTQIIDNSYSTRIELDIFPDIIEKIKMELNALDFRELLFLKHIEKVIINIDSKPERIIKRIPNEKSIYITEKMNNEEKASIWSIYPKNGIIDKKNYEFVIAYSDNIEIQNELRNKGVLYSFFKTDLQMPFPFIIHVTLDLSSDRNGLQKESQYNHKLIDELVIFIGETAKSIAENSKKYDYEPLKLLLPKNNIDTVLENSFNFSEKLEVQIESLNIFPAIDNKYISINDKPKYCNLPFDKVVNKQTFSSLLKCCDDEVVREYLNKKLVFYNESETTKLIDQDADRYSNEEKISLLELFMQYFMPYSHSSVLKYAPKIMCDYDGNRITDDSRIFNNPTKHFELPNQNWAKLKFISPIFEDRLSVKFGLQKSDLYLRFSRFNVAPYSFDNILRQLITQAGDNENNIKELLQWLFSYWISNNNQFGTVLTNVEIKIISRNRKVIKCNDCYFGKEYKNDIGENILTVVGAEFLAEPKILGFENSNDIDLLVKFFEQLGICKYPRKYCKSLDADEKNIYLSKNEKTYTELYDRYGEKFSYSELYLHNASLKVDYIDNIEQVLEKVETDSILLWILSDEGLQKILTSQNEISDTSVLISDAYKKQYQREFKNKNLISFLRMIFQNVEWLSTKSGKKVNVSNCTVEDYKLSPLIETIVVNYNKLSEKLGRLVKKDLELFFYKLGIAENFTKLSKEKIYDVFLKIPNESSIEKSICRSIYNQFNLAFVAAEIEKMTDNNSKYDEFKKNGQVLCSYNGELVYKPVCDVFYANNKVYSDEILSKYPILVLNRRQGEVKICKTFCVKPIKEIGEIKVKSITHPLNDEFQKEYRLLLPYIYAKRIGKDKEGKELRELRKSNINLVSFAETECIIGNELIKGKLKDYELIQARSENTAYIKIPQNITNIDNLRKELHFCETLSELFTVFLNVESDKSFFSQIIGASKLDRDFLYKSDGDTNLTTLNFAKEKFDKDLSHKEEFWNAVARVLGQDETEFDYSKYLQIIKNDFDYKDLCKDKQPQNIIELFTNLNIDICDYNQTAYQPIYLLEYYKNIYEKLKEEYIKSKKEYFYEYWKLDIPIFENSINVNVEEIFKKQIESLVNEIQKKQEQANNNQKKETVSQKENEDVASEAQSYENIKKEAEKRGVLNIQKADIEKPDSNTGLSKSSTGKQRQGIVDNKQKEIIGFIGELEVYKSLKQQQENKEISAFEWISGNSVKNGTTYKDDANDGAGYDFEVSFDGITKTYIEVKASSQSGIVFDITKNEIDFAKDHKENYNIYFVQIKDDIPQKIIDLGCIFNFKDGEDFFSSKSFKVEQKAFTIRATIKV